MTDLTRRVVRVRRYDSIETLRISPDEFHCPDLAAVLADYWVRISPEIGTATYEVRRSITNLCRTVGRLPGADELTVQTLRRSHLDRVEQQLLEQQAAHPADGPYRKMTYLLALLRRIDHDEPGLLHPEISKRIEMGTRLVHMRGRGDVPFSIWERRQMIGAAMRLVRQALAAGHCDQDAVIATCILLAHSTGEPTEVLRQLTTKSFDVIPAADAPLPTTAGFAAIEQITLAGNVEAFHLDLTKNRGHIRSDITITRTQRMAFWATSSLINLTAPHRLPEHGDAVWIVAPPNGPATRVNWARSDIWGLRDWTTRHLTPAEAGTLAARTQPAITEPVVWRRFRKHAVVREAMSDPLGFRSRRRRHSDDTFFGSYAADPALVAQAGKDLVASSSALFDAATRPTVIPPSLERHLADGTASLDDVDVNALLHGRLDGPLAACRNPEAPPPDVPGPVCGAFANGRCYTCPNAIITRRHLPGVLRLADLLHPDQFGRPDRWAATWKPVFDYLNDIVLPQFSDDDITNARAATANVYLDAGLHQELGTA